MSKYKKFPMSMSKFQGNFEGQNFQRATVKCQNVKKPNVKCQNWVDQNPSNLVNIMLY